MFKFFFNWDNILVVLASAIVYPIGTSLSDIGFSLVGLVIFTVVMFILNPFSLKITDYIVGKEH